MTVPYFSPPLKAGKREHLPLFKSEAVKTFLTFELEPDEWANVTASKAELDLVEAGILSVDDVALRDLILILRHRDATKARQAVSLIQDAELRQEAEQLLTQWEERCCRSN